MIWHGVLDDLVAIRVCGLPDRRVERLIDHENQPAKTLRAKTLERRCLDAGWPPDPYGDDVKKLATAAVRRLEGVDFIWNGDRHHDQFRVAAYTSRSRRREITISLDDDRPPSIFDE